MTRHLAILIACFAAFCSQGQGTLPPAQFEWNPPLSLTNATGYRLQWGPQDAAELPLHQTLYEVENLPVGLALPVSVSTTGSTTNSQPSTIHVYNIEVLVEESTDLAIWQTIGSVSLRGQRKPVSFLRLKLNQPAGNQGGD